MDLTVDELRQCFLEYASTVEKELSATAPHRPKIEPLTRVQSTRLLEAVEWLESRPVFRELVEATREAFQDKDHHSSPFYNGWAAAAGHFFRRSGFYQDCFERRKHSDCENLLPRYVHAFRTREVKVTYLLLLEWVSLVEPREGVLYPRREPIECGSFALRRYSREKLESLSGNRVNRVFYPYAVWDTEKLAWYWYVTVSGSTPIMGIGKITLDFSKLRYIRRQLVPDWLTRFRMPLCRLVLYDWLPEGFEDRRDLIGVWPENLEGFSWSAIGIRYSVEWVAENERYLHWIPWRGFRVPFALECNGDLIHAPSVAPDTATLQLESQSGLTGEEIISPASWMRFELDTEATAMLERLIRDELQVVDTSLLERWSFYDVALEYLSKAFQTSPYEAPAEQLLWHVTALEALLGRKKDTGLVKAIRQRLGRLLGGNARERQRIRYYFTKLYDVRSDLVHGNPWGDRFTLCLYLARNFARQACLRYAELARSCIREKRPLPSRDDIITALDEGRFDELLGKKP